MKKFIILLGFVSLILFAACSENKEAEAKANISTESNCTSSGCGESGETAVATASSDCAGCPSNKADVKSISNDNNKAKVTFIELGSVNCIPCKQMVPVMKNVEKNFGDQVNVVFYDVWKPEQKKYAEQYKVKIIPTQVFLDEEGNEFHRHEGFYPEDEISKVLQAKGLVAN